MESYHYEGSVWELFEELLYGQKSLDEIRTITIGDGITIEEIAPKSVKKGMKKIKSFFGGNVEMEIERVKFYIEAITEQESVFLERLREYLICLKNLGYDKIDEDIAEEFYDVDRDAESYDRARKYGFCYNCESALPRIPIAKYTIVHRNENVLGIYRLKEELGLVKKYRVYMIAFSDDAMEDALSCLHKFGFKMNPVRIYKNDGSVEEYYTTHE